MKLSQHEIQTPLWAKLVEHHNEELRRMRARAEHPLCPNEERMGLLWRIYQIKEFLALAEPERKGDGRKP